MTVREAPTAPDIPLRSHSGGPSGRSDRLRLRGSSRADVAELAGALLGSFALIWLVYEELTTLSGGLGFFVCWFFAFLAMYWAMARNRLGAGAAADRLAAATVASVGLLLAVGLAAILIYVAEEGYHALRPTFFTKDQYGVLPFAKPTAGGGLAAIVGTVEQVGLATLMSLPLGVATAVFLTEVRGSIARPVRLLTDAMSGIPSVLTGLFIFAVLIESHVLAYSGFAVSLALTISMLPTITRTSEVVLRVVPGDLREASYALGGSEWRTVRRILLPTARTGLITAAILGVARVVGEAAPAIIDAGGSAKVNYNPFNGQQENLPLMIYDGIRTSMAADHVRAWTAALVLVMMVLVLFVTARAIARQRTGGMRRPLNRFLDRKGTS